MFYSVIFAEIPHYFLISSACCVRCEDFSGSTCYSSRDWQHCLPSSVCCASRKAWSLKFLLLVEVRSKSSFLQHAVYVVNLLLEGFNLLNVICISVAFFLHFGKTSYKFQFCDSWRWTGHGWLLPDIYFKWFIVTFAYWDLWKSTKIARIFKWKSNVPYKSTSHSNVLYLRSSIFITVVYFKQFNLQQ